MKRKIALLLALIMTLSLMPVTVFARSSNGLRGTKRDSIRNESIFYAYETKVASDITNNSAFLNTYDRDESQRKGIASNGVYDAQYFVMTLNDETATAGQMFRLELENAIWMFTVTSADSYSTRMSLVEGAGYITDPISSPLSFSYDATVAGATKGDISYTMSIDGSNNQTTATITIDATGGEAIWIPLTMYVSDNNVAVNLRFAANMSSFTTGTYNVVNSAGSGSANSFKTIRTGRDIINLDTLIMKETRPGSFGDGAIEISAPSGYRFVSNPSKWTFTAVPNFGLSNAEIYYRDIDSEGTSYIILFSDVDTSVNKLAGSIEIDGIIIEPINVNSVVLGRDLKISISNYKIGEGARFTLYSQHPNYGTIAALDSATSGVTGEFGISGGDVDCAKSVDYTVTLTSEGSPKLIAGRLDVTNGAFATNTDIHRSAYFVFEEQELNAWNAAGTTTFVLPDGVKILGLEIDSSTNVNVRGGGSLSGAYNAGNVRTALAQNGSRTSYIDPNSDIRFEVGQFSLRNLVVNSTNTSTNGGKAKIRMRLDLSIDPNFADDKVELSVKGSGIETSSATIATVAKPISIKANTTSVDVGRSDISVADITITENEPGAIRRLIDATNTLNISLADSFGVYNYFAPITMDQVKITGDLGLKMATSSTSGVISFDVTHASTEASTIVISGLVVKLNRDVPEGIFDLVVYGDSVFANYETDAGGNFIQRVVGYDANGYAIYGNISSKLTGHGRQNRNGFTSKDYIKVVTPGAGAGSGVTNTVKFAEGSRFFVVNGETKEMDAAPFIYNGNEYPSMVGSLLVPLRFAGEGFGASVVWDSETRVATLTIGGRVVEVRPNTYIAHVADTSMPRQPREMTNVNGEFVYSIIVESEGRMYLPIRALANLFEIGNDKVDWNDSAREATFN